MKHLLQRMTLALLVAGLIFYSCKKERSSEGYQTHPPTGNTNKPPVALAGTDETITLPTDSILLDGSVSSDPDGTITSWLWTKISGPVSFLIVNPNLSKTQVKNVAEGIYLFELKVTDSGGLTAKDTVQVTVKRTLFNPNFSNVYIAGWGKNVNGKTVARIWNNNLLQNLSDGQDDAGAYSVAVSGSDVYVAGYDGIKAILWKNSVKQNLGNGIANSVFVSGSDVYVAGRKDTSAILWKNGAAQILGTGTANSVFVSGSDVYVAGLVFDSIVGGASYSTCTVWKNGVPQTLQDDYESSFPISVFVSGNDIYVAGTSYFMFSFGLPTFWKNGASQFLGPREGWANSVFVSGSDVYVAGIMLGSGNDAARATIWKNGEAINQTNGQNDAIAYSVFISGNSVYATGGKYNNSSNESSLWINGTEYIISGLISANSVFVK